MDRNPESSKLNKLHLIDISLVKAGLNDAEAIHTMQIKSFMPLLEKYQDYETNPGNETIDKVINRINHTFTDYYIIKSQNILIGGIRIIKNENKHYRVSPVFILPEYQGKGIAQKVFQMIEQTYCDAEEWELDTILQERGNCYLYEKIGYRQTGETKVINDKLTLVFYKKMVD